MSPSKCVSTYSPGELIPHVSTNVPKIGFYGSNIAIDIFLRIVLDFAYALNIETDLPEVEQLASLLGSLYRCMKLRGLLHLVSMRISLYNEDIPFWVKAFPFTLSLVSLQYHCKALSGAKEVSSHEQPRTIW